MSDDRVLDRPSTTASWRELVAPVSATLECSSRTHRITWGADGFALEDHDTAADRTLAALGGPASACAKVAELWRHMIEDWSVLRPVIVNAEPPADRPLTKAVIDPQVLDGVSLSPPGKGGHDPRRPDPSTRERERSRRRMIRRLPPDLRLRLALDAVSARSEQLAGGDERAELADLAMLRSLLGPPVRRWIQAAGPAVGTVRASVGCRVACANEKSLIDGRLDEDRSAVVFARLPLQWIADVWATGLTNIDERLVAAIGGIDRDGDTSRVDVLAVAWTRADQERFERHSVTASSWITAYRKAGAWSGPNGR